MDCANCGLELPRSEGNLYGGDDEIVCLDCKATNHIGIDDDRDEVYVSRFTCRHGKDDEDACDLCAAIDAATEGKP